MNLLFLGAPVAYQRRLDLERRVLEPLNARSRCHDKYCASCLSQLERALHIHRVKRVFDSACLRAQAFDHFFQLAADGEQPLGEAQVLRPSNTRVLDQVVVPAVAIDHAVAGCVAPRIDADYSHR